MGRWKKFRWKMKILREGWSAVGWEKSGIEKWDHNLCWDYSWDLELQKSIMTRCWFKMPRGIEELRDQKKCSPHYQSEHKFLRKKFKSANWSLFFKFSHNRHRSNFDINRAQFEKKIFRATVELKFKAEIWEIPNLNVPPHLNTIRNQERKCFENRRIYFYRLNL